MVSARSAPGRRHRDVTPGPVSGLILAGGRGRRLGGIDKGLLPIRGRALVDHVVDALRPQVTEIQVATNRNAAEYEKHGLTVIPDALPGFEGPLSGMLSGLKHCRNDWLLCVPCDAPRLPSNLAERLVDAANEASSPASCIRINGRINPVICLLHRSLVPNLDDYLGSGQRRSLDWMQRVSASEVDIGADRAEDYVWSLNTRSEVERWREAHC